MRKYPVLVLVVILAMAPATPLRAFPEAAAVREILEERVDRYEKSVGIVVGMIDAEKSEVVAYGKTARDGLAPDGDTVFEIGSATKVFTAILLADMVRRGELSLDDPVAKSLPDSVRMPTKDGEEITFLHLTTHTSGLPRMPDNMTPEDPMNPYADYTVEQMYAFLSGYELTREIGAQPEYSNLGVGLLGHALALEAGMDYETLVRKRILEPLGMKDTTITLTPELEARLAVGHDAGLAPVSNWDIPALAGAGALRSTVNDMLKFLAANLSLSRSPLYEAMEDTHGTRSGFGADNVHVGMGWLILEDHGSEITWHNGGTGGYHSFVGFDREKRTGVVVLSNSSNDIDDIGLHLLEDGFALAELKPPPKAIAVDAAVLESYVGRYQLAPSFIINVSLEDGRLFAQATNQPSFELFAESESKFFLKVVDAQISFVRDDDGAVDYLILHQGGLDQKAKRMTADGKVEFGPAEALVLSPEVLEPYVGRYEVAPGFGITVTRVENRLRVQATGQPEVEIFAESATEFFFREVDAGITFEVAEDGTVDRLILHQGGRDTPAERTD